MRRDAVESRLAALRAVNVSDPHAAEAIERALRDRSNLVLAAAAEMAAALGLAELGPRMVRAFGPLVADGPRADKGCRAKLAIVRALRRLDADDLDALRAGVRCVQLEPVFGGRQDTAAELRVESLAALFAIGCPEAPLEAAQLLADPELDARVGAARLLAQARPPAAEALLRLRALVPDPEPAAQQEYLAAVLAIDPRNGVPFAARFLDDPREPVAQAAAFALGESRLQAALAALGEAIQARRNPAAMPALLAAVAVMRRDDALDLLVRVIAEEPEAVALEAVEAVSVYAHDAALVARVRQAAAERGSPRLRRAAAQRLGQA